MPRDDEAGFSLLETIIAFAVAAAALAALLQIYASSGSASRRSLDMLKAVEIADREIAALNDPDLLAPGAWAPVTEGGLTWQMEIAPEAEEADTAHKDAVFTLVHVTLTVARETGGEPVLQVVTARRVAVE